MQRNVRRSSCNVGYYCLPLTKIGICCNNLVKTPNVKFNKNLFSSSQVVLCILTDGWMDGQSILTGAP
jgi:hypothetical protein